ncbi:MAG TPA: transcription antitermination factor NusB [Pseudothermotoga sp.]|nr:transcription antitermination factor NusB [Pseudothermotoga sp.]HOK83714.1 transcription antitermination factor NusB [Pseudothermotoga sp.]HPP69353.1 transcription antitermination factor NusB [Pseudothermotoga sp.]
MRDIVFKTIFQNEFRNESTEILVKEIMDREKEDSVKDDVVRYVRGIYENLPQIDEKISVCLENWHFERLSSVDRCVLRLGTYELLYEKDVPIEVTLDEAVELAKKYGTENSGRFVNGVLDRIAKSFAPEPKYHI